MVCAVAQILLKGQEEVRARCSAPEEKVHSLPVSSLLSVSITRGSDRRQRLCGWPFFSSRLVARADGWKPEAEGCSTLVYQVHGDLFGALHIGVCKSRCLPSSSHQVTVVLYQVLILPCSCSHEADSVLKSGVGLIFSTVKKEKKEQPKKATPF